MKTLELYIIRHCESESNVNDVFQGQTDGGVTPKGITQAQRVAARLSDVAFDAIYTSPLIRAHTTATAIHAAQPHSTGTTAVPVYLRRNLREINAGRLEGLTIAQIERDYPAEYEWWRGDIARFVSPGGESFVQLYERVRAEFTAIAEDAGRRGYSRICVVAHGAVLYAFFNYANGFTAEGSSNNNFWVDNASVSRVQYDGEFNVIYLNDISHFDKDTQPYVMFLADNARNVNAES